MMVRKTIRKRNGVIWFDICRSCRRWIPAIAGAEVPAGIRGRQHYQRGRYGGSRLWGRLDQCLFLCGKYVSPYGGRCIIRGVSCDIPERLGICHNTSWRVQLPWIYHEQGHDQLDSEKWIQEVDYGTFTETNHRERHWLYTGRWLLYPWPAAAGGIPSYRTLGTDAPGLSERMASGLVQWPAFVRQVLDVPCRPKRTGTEPAGGNHRADESRQYAAIQELDEAMLHRLISRIVVGEMKKVDGQKQQEVKIIYNFVGEIPE